MASNPVVGLNRRIQADRDLLRTLRPIFAKTPYAEVKMEDLAATARLSRASVQRRYSKPELRVRSDVPLRVEELGEVLRDLDAVEKSRSTHLNADRLGALQAWHTIGLAHELAEQFDDARRVYTRTLDEIATLELESVEPMELRDLRDLKAEVLTDRALLRRTGVKWWSHTASLDPVTDVPDLEHALHLTEQLSELDPSGRAQANPWRVAHLRLRLLPPAHPVPDVTSDLRPRIALPFELRMLATRIALGPIPYEVEADARAGDLTTASDPAAVATRPVAYPDVSTVDVEIGKLLRLGYDSLGTDPFRSSQAFARAAVTEVLFKTPAAFTEAMAHLSVWRKTQPADAYVVEDLVPVVSRLLEHEEEEFDHDTARAILDMTDALEAEGTAWVRASLTTGRAGRLLHEDKPARAGHLARLAKGAFDDLRDRGQIEFDTDDVLLEQRAVEIARLATTRLDHTHPDDASLELLAALETARLLLEERILTLSAENLSTASGELDRIAAILDDLRRLNGLDS